METVRLHPLLVTFIGLAVAAAAALLGSGPANAIPSLSITVAGNHFVNGDGQAVRLLGVNATGTEFACEEGWGYSSVPISQASANAIAGWDADAVRVPLNEDCWLGLNGQPSGSIGLSAAGYRQAIETWVADLNAAGLYAILDLHWSAPGATVADGQRPMPDDNSVAFWTSVATTFKSNPAVVFDAFNEPYSPAADGVSTLSVSWTCWENGGCSVPITKDGTTAHHAPSYTAVGMQTVVDAIRATGATQPIMLGGLSYANDLHDWLVHEPTDPDDALVASFHNYFGEHCDSAACWNTTIAPVAAKVPVVTGEFDQGYDCADPPTRPTGLTTFDDTFMDWADANGVSYLAWGWYDDVENSGASCSTLVGGGTDSFSLVSNTTTGAPVAPDGTTVRAHLEALAAAGTPPVTVTSPGTPPTAAPTGTGAPPAPPPTPPTAGYDLVGADGGVFVFPGGSGGFYGSLPGLGVGVNDVVGMVPSSDGRGYFLVGRDGGVFSFGDTGFEGSLPGIQISVDDVVGIVPTADDRGYLLVGRDGGVFAFGDATFLGSLPGEGQHVDDVVGIASAAGGSGYWVIEANGAVTAFGSAASCGNATVTGPPVTAIAGTPHGTGYWVVTADGGVQSYGSAPFRGSLPALGVAPAVPVVALVPTLDDGGYWLVGSDGGVFGFGDAAALGSLPGLGVAVDDIAGGVPTAP